MRPIARLYTLASGSDQRPDWLAVAGELVDCGGSVQAGRAGNEDCHGHRLLVLVGWVNSRTRAALVASSCRPPGRSVTNAAAQSGISADICPACRETSVRGCVEPERHRACRLQSGL